MRPEAILLLGPTGAGKTPLGDRLAREGLEGRPCRHLDFGARLRAVAAGAHVPPGLGAADVAAVRRALAEGALLTDDQFPIAAAIVAEVVASAPRDAWIVLNGLPRHRGQARAVDALLDVRRVLWLDAPLAVVLARIRADAGGDRAARPDDDEEAVRARYQRFLDRTKPVLEHYAARGARVLRIPVGPRGAAGTMIGPPLEDSP